MDKAGMNTPVPKLVSFVPVACYIVYFIYRSNYSH